MSGNEQRIIANEGAPVLVALLILAAATYILIGLFSSLFFILLFFMAGFLFRDPLCEIPAAPLAVLSPASGRVLSVSQVDDPWLSRPAIMIRIEISVWDVHSLRCPTEGKIMNQWSTGDGKQEFDRQYAYWLQTDEGDDLLMALGINSAAKFTRMTIFAGERAGQGQRCGFLYFAGVIDVYLPENSRISIKAGDKVAAGSAILGQFVHGDGASSMTGK